jgi:hypothetical protein
MEFFVLFSFFLQADLKVNPIVWGKLSEESKTLMTSLLNKVRYIANTVYNRM